MRPTGKEGWVWGCKSWFPGTCLVADILFIIIEVLRVCMIEGLCLGTGPCIQDQQLESVEYDYAYIHGKII